jgi:hypothetical protein
MLFCRTGLMRCKAGKTQGPVLLPPFCRTVATASGKITNALAAAPPNLFYRLSPKAARLTVRVLTKIYIFLASCHAASFLLWVNRQ